MADLREKVKLTLDEARMLVLGAQILLGFQFRSFVEQEFDALPEVSKHLKLLSLIAVLVAMVLLMWPATYQQIAEDGEANGRMFRFSTSVMCWALLPFALALGMEVFTVSEKLCGTAAGAGTGTAVTAAALGFWYGLELVQRRRRPGAATRERTMESDKNDGRTPLKDKIDDVLTEARVVIPGAQALLGFQLIVMLNQGFDKLPALSKYVHLGSLLLIALSTILLMTPAAYHRIVERGEDTEGFWRLARRMLLSSMVPLAAGLAGDVYVVAQHVTGSQGVALGLAAAVLAGAFGAWFGFTAWRRWQREPRDRRWPRAVGLKAHG